MSSRETVLGRVQRALADVPAGDPQYEQAVTRGYLRRHQDLDAADAVDLLAANLAEYRAHVHRTDTGALPQVIARLLAERGSRTVLVPPALPAEWLAHAGPAQVRDSAANGARELDEVDSVVTGCAVAVAETGTIVLDGSGDQGRRRITLIPDHHICVVRAPAQVVVSLPDVVERLDPGRPLTWISGPSATSDIELDRVEGVHGPRRLDVVLVVDTAESSATSQTVRDDCSSGPTDN